MKLVMRSLPGLALGVAMLFGAGCASLSNRAVCPAEGGPTWHEVRSAHFLVRTNLDPARAQKVTLDLERFRRALLLIWTRNFDPPGRLEVIVLRSRGQIEEFSVKGTTAFAYFTGSGPIIAMEASDGTFFGKAVERQAQAHALARYLSRFVLPRQPRWFAEGLSSFLETAHLNDEGTQAVFGEPHRGFLAYVRESPWMTLEELWRWDFSTPKGQPQHYASSWFWVHYLLNEQGPRFTDFQMRLARAEEPRQAFEAAFAGAGDLEEGLRRYLKGGTFGRWTFPLEGVPTELQVRELEGAEVHALRARLYLMGNARTGEERRKAAQLEVTQALSENPTNVSAVVLQAGFTDNDVERLAMAEALVKAHPDSGPAWELLAQAHSQAGSPVALQEQAYLRAAELSPDAASVHNNLAWLYAQSKVPRKGLALAVRAVKLAPFWAPYRDTYAAVLFEMGQCAKSIEAQRRAIELLHESMPEAMRQDFQGRLTRYETVCRERAAAGAAEKEESTPGP